MFITLKDESVELPDDLFDLLVWCAVSHDRRLPNGEIPPVIEKILGARTDYINDYKDSYSDQMGAEIRRP